MAFQESPFEFRGNIGKLNFFKRKGIFQVRRKGGVTANRIFTDPAFAATRDNTFEFGKAGRAGRKIRNAFAELTQDVKDGTASLRMTQFLMQVLQADATSDRGKREILPANLGVLEGFQFNNDAVLEETLKVHYTATMARDTGLFSVSIPSFVPFSKIQAPENATHFRIAAAASPIDFDVLTNVVSLQSTADILINTTPTAAITLSGNITPGSTLPIFMVVGIYFSKLMNGKFYPLGKRVNALQLIRIVV